MTVEIEMLGEDYEVPSSAADQNWAAQLVAFLQAVAEAVDDQQAAISALTNITFAARTLLNSWANIGGAQAAQSALGANGIVYVRASIDTGASGSVAFQLPAGQRPAAEVRIPIDCSGGVGTVTIAITGNVTITNNTAGSDVSAGAYLNFSFPAVA